MVETLAHRGPDNSGILVADGVALGHTRLSIIDVSHTADQPFTSADRRYAIVYNGELYNYPRLRAELIGDGVAFRTKSDTEVVLNAFIHWGEACLHRFHGMFAFAVYDFETRRLFGARDRFGIKPFHYSIVNGRLFFASEIKALLRIRSAPPRVDTRKWVELLMYREIIAEDLMRGVRTLEPGHSLSLGGGGGGRPGLKRWFHVSELPDRDYSARLAGMSRNARADELERVLDAAVQSHLISDVPVGTLCSGGVDSSLMTAMACKSAPDLRVYHVDMQGRSERKWAELVARHLDIELNYYVLDEEAYLANYIECIYFNDYPLTHPQNGAIYYISSLARQQGCKVLLAGEGADEVFGGYDWRHRLRYNYRRFEQATGVFRKIMRKVLFATTGVWAEQFNPRFSFKAWSDVDTVMAFVCDQNYRRDLEAECRAAYGFIPDPVEREAHAAVTSDLRDYIGGILHQQDRASMQASIESRVPFLDVEVARLGANLPLRDKFSWRESKRLLKQVALRHLPREVVFRPKVGFAGPTSEHVMKLGTRIFDDGFLQEELALEPAQVSALLRQDPGSFAHMLYGLEYWGRMFVWGESPAALKERILGC
jgi:asparagine synthase (glutamine-hydrolysing)